MSSRKIFGTDGIRGVANQWPMTPELALKIGQAFALTFPKKSARQKILIGKDTRLSCYMLEQALAAGIASMGGDVYLVGPLPTPGVAFLTASMRADAGVMISASHNAYMDNGIKFFCQQGFKLPDPIEEAMEKIIESDDLIDDKRSQGKDVGKAYRINDSIGRYIVFLKNTFPNELTLEGLTVVLDCANGAAYKVGPAALEELGARVFSMGCSPNGTNINHQCGSLHPEAMQEKVRSVGADIGIALDGDADRVIFCDHEGTLIHGDLILGTLACYLKSKNQLARNTMVATVMSNMGLEVGLRQQGIQFIRTPVGDRYVVEEMLKSGYNFGGEQSGHIIFLDKNSTGDGMIGALQILAMMIQRGEPLKVITQGLHIFPQNLINLKVREKTDLDTMPSVKKAIQSAHEQLGEEGRVLVRYSGTELLARVMVEGRDEKLVQAIAENIAHEIKQKIGL